MSIQGLRARMVSIECYSIELALLLASGWATQAMLRHPSPFDTFPVPFDLATRLSKDVVAWAMFTLTAATLKLSGLLLAAFGRRRIGMALRVSGLWMSVVFWSVMSISVLVSFPEAIFAAWGAIGAGSALWLMIRWPTEV